MRLSPWIAVFCCLVTLNEQKDSFADSELDLSVSDEWLRRFEKNERLTRETYQRFLTDPTPGVIFYYLANDTAFVEFAASYELLRKKMREGGERFRMGFLSIPDDYHPRDTRDMLLEDLPGLTVYHNCVPFTVSTELDPSNLSFLPRYIAEIRGATLEVITHQNKEKMRRSNRDYKVIYFSRGEEYYSVMSTLQHRTKDYASVFVIHEEAVVKEFFASKNIELSVVGNFLLACYQETTNQIVYFDQETSIYNIVRFVLSHRFPKWPVFNQLLWNWAQDNHVDLLLFFYQDKELNDYKDKLEQMAPELLTRRVVPTKAYLNNEFSRRFIEEFGLTRHVPNLVMFQPHIPGLPKYVYHPKATNVRQSLLEFIWKSSSQKYRPFMKSDLPTKRTFGPIQIAVSDNFDSRVLDGKKRHHSLVFFIDKDIQPIISKFKDAVLQIKPPIPHLKFFVFNCSSNEHPFVTSDFKRRIVMVPRGARRYGGHANPSIMDPEASLTSRSLLDFVFDTISHLDQTIKNYFDNNHFD